MSPNERQQMCLECHGRIPLDVEQCPYCGTKMTDFNEEPIMTKPTLPPDSTASLYPPPYKAAGATLFEEKKSPLFAKTSDPLEKKFASPPGSQLPNIPEEKSGPMQSGFFPLLFLSLSAHLFLIGFLQLCFSHEGRLTLEWNSAYWFVYCLLAIPFFLVGLKKTHALK